jgi:Reverse transcriptase (RNA-dependent DNA polymerase)
LFTNNILIPEQHGFLKGKNTVTALFDFVTHIYGALEAREKINVILYDFSNAFGTIYPPLLIKKLQSYGLNGMALSWLESFLTNREQYVEIRDLDIKNVEKHIHSELLISNMGVPQGTVLGPTSFLVYLNDITLFILIAFLIFFADDSSGIIKAKSFIEANSLTKIVNDNFIKYAENNFLKINASKTILLQMHTWQTKNLVPPQIQINSVDVSVKSNGKLLGVQIMDTMNWNDQCERVSNKLRSLTYMFTILCDIVPLASLKAVYYAYAQSQVMYSIVIWGGSTHMEKVFVAQKRILRAMAGIQYWRSNKALDSCRPLFQRFDILTVYSLYILECMKFLKKNPNHFAKECDKPGGYLRVTRNNQDNVCPNDLYVPKCDLKLSNQNPNVMIPRIFNALPKRIKLIDCDKMFIKSVNLYIRERQFYDLHEYFLGD